MHDGCVFELLRDFTFTPHLLEERSQVIHQLGTSVLVDLSRDCVRSGCFHAEELLHGPDGLLERWREVDVHVGLHLRQTLDGGVGDDGGAVEDASEMLGPSLQDLRLLSQESVAVGAEERSSALRRRTVDSFDSREEVLLSVAVRVALDLLSAVLRSARVEGRTIAFLKTARVVDLAGRHLCEHRTGYLDYCLLSHSTFQYSENQ
nr:unnamed protein product [Spirometra erinaceieuropaei]